MYGHTLGKGGYQNLKKKLQQIGDNLQIINGSTNQAVDLMGMGERTKMWLAGHSKQDQKDKNRFIVEGMAVDVLNDTVHKFILSISI